MQICELNCEFNIEWHSILSGGKPTFPTCEFPSLDWYPRSISISSQLLPWVGFRSFTPSLKPAVCDKLLLINSAREKTAIDNQNLAVHKTGCVGGEKDCGARQLLNISKSPHGRSRQKFAPTFSFIQELCVEGRAKHSWRNRVYANAMRRPFDRQRFR